MAPKRLTPSDLLALREVEDPRISPDGETIAFVRVVLDGKANLYRRSIWTVPYGGGRPRRLASGKGKGDWCPRWSPSGDRLAFVSHRTTTPQIFTIRPAGTQERQLTRISTGAGSPAWSPDGLRIAFLSRVTDEESGFISAGKGLLRRGQVPPPLPAPDPRVVNRILYREGMAYDDGRRSHVFVVPLKGKGRIRQISRGKHDHGPPLFGPKGKHLFTTSNRRGDVDADVVSNIVRFRTSGGEGKVLTRNLNHCSDLKLTPDGRSLLYYAMPGEKFYAHSQTARLLPLKGGREKVVSSRLDGDVEGVGCFPMSGAFLVVAALEGNRRVYRIDKPGAEPVPITPVPGWVDGFAVAPNHDRYAVAFQAPDHPADLFRGDEGGGWHRLTDLNRSFMRPLPLSLPREVRFKGKGGLPIQGWYLPPWGRPARKAPLVVQIHGGPHVCWGNSFAFEFQMLASQGFGVFYCNPRGSDGYGLDFKGMLFRNWAVDDSVDVLRGMEEVLRRGWGNRKKLYITGGSYGGYMTAWILGQEKRFRAGVVQRGVYNLGSFYGCSDVQMLMEWEFETYPWDDPTLYWKHSPLSRVRNITTPVLILHAECDYRAPISTAEEFYVALKKLGRTTEFVRYPREGHELSRSGEPVHRVDRLRRILAWFKKHP